MKPPYLLLLPFQNKKEHLFTFLFSINSCKPLTFNLFPQSIITDNNFPYKKPSNSQFPKHLSEPKNTQKSKLSIFPQHQTQKHQLLQHQKFLQISIAYSKKIKKKKKQATKLTSLALAGAAGMGKHVVGGIAGVGLQLVLRQVPGAGVDNIF